MMKKLVALLMALALLCTSVGAFATDEVLEAAIEETVQEEPAVEEVPVTPEPEESEEPEKAKEDYEVVIGEHYADEKDRTENCKEPTCFEDGYIEYTCQDKKCTVKTFKKTLPKLEHAIPTDAKIDTDSVITKAATCTEPGIRTWSKCANGNHSWEETIIAIGHAWTKKLTADGKPVVTEPTCTKKGFTTYVCTRCDAEKEDDHTDALGHDWAPNPRYADSEDIPDYNPEDPDTWQYYIWTEVNSASCVDGGKLVKFTYCARCHIKDIISEQSNYWDKLDHQAFLKEFIEQPADDDTDYYEWLEEKVILADRANDDLINNIIVCGGHEIEGTEDPTYKAYHHPVQIIKKAPTCTEKGLLTLACTKCPAKVEVEIPATDHDYQYEELVGPTCFTNGKLMVYCGNDNCTYMEQVDIAAPGHHNYDKTKAWYYQEKYFETVEHGTEEDIAKCIDYIRYDPCVGFKQKFILSTGYEFTYKYKGCTEAFKNEIPGNGIHDKATENYAFRPATCMKEGYEYFYCNACGYSYGQTLPKEKHNLKYRVVKPCSCEDDGYAYWECQNKGCDYYEEQTLPKTGHSYDVLKKEDHQDETCTEDGFDIYTCRYCGDSYIEWIPKHHFPPLRQEINPDENNNQAYKAPTCTEQGERSYECTRCHQPVLNEKIPPLGHDYVGNYIIDGQKWDTYFPATCQNGAYYRRDCTRCDYFEETEPTEKLGHLMARRNQEGQIEVSSLVLDTSNLPTCDKTGKAYYNCVVCKELVEDFVMPKLPCNEEVVWDPDKFEWVVTCVNAPWDLWDDMIQDTYLWDEIASCTEDEELAARVYADVMNEFRAKLYQKNQEFIPGIGCGVTKTIPVIKTHYSIELNDGVIKLTPDENCVLLTKPMVIVNWAYIMSDGTCFSYTRLFSEEVAGTLTYDLGMAETPVGAVLDSITAIVTDTRTLSITEAAKGFGFDQWPKK